MLALGGVIGVVVAGGRLEGTIAAPARTLEPGTSEVEALRLRADPPEHYLRLATVQPVEVFVTRVDAEVLIPGIGQPVANGTVIFDDRNRIIYSGSQSAAPEQPEANMTVHVKTVMPGLWDCHTHFSGSVGPNSPFIMTEEFPANYLAFHDAVQQLHETLMMGITSVREVGGEFGQPLHELLRTGRAVGPNFHFAGRALGMTAGHADSQTKTLEYVRQLHDRNEGFGALCDGVPECVKRVREQLRMQADIIKVMASGGVLSEFDEPTDTEMSLEELKAIVDEARRARRAVAAHVHGTGGIQNAIDAGVTSIEHGTYMTEAQADALIEKSDDIIYVPTALIAQEFFNGTRPAGLDDNQWRKGVGVLAHHTAAIKMAIKKGVPIATGTDCPHRCAEVGKEIGYLHMFGMSPLEAIQAATGNAPRCMGQFGLMPKSGRLMEGYEADVIALDVNPLEDLAALTLSERITHVWKGGVSAKSPEPTARLRSLPFTQPRETTREEDISAGLPW